MSRPAAGLAPALALAAALVAAPAGAQVAAPADSFARYFAELSDSTDARFGAASVSFDTTGLDSLATHALSLPPRPGPRGGGALFPVLGFHRAQGAIVGAGWRGGSPATGILEARGAYATSAKLGRYAFSWRRTLWTPGGRLPRFQARREGRIGERRRLDLELRYARENRPFMPEHADASLGSFGALFGGDDAQSIFEARGGSAALALWAGDWRLRAGLEGARERALPRATTFSLFGRREEVPDNIAADEDEFTAPFGDVAFLRRDWELAAVLAARGGGGERWRLRGAVGKSLRLGPDLKLTTQVEGGATAAGAPRQRRFELGGALAVPTLDYGTGGTDHLLFGRGELVASPNVLEALGVPHPGWLVLQPSLFVDYGNAWDDPAGRDVVFSKPPGTTWRGAAGGGLSWRLGVPEPDVTMRIWMAWPVGPNAGSPRLSIDVGRRLGLLGVL